MAWAFVQAKNQALTNNATNTIKFAANTVAGNRAILCIAAWNTATTITVSDAKNGSWTLDKTVTTPGGALVRMFSVQVATQLLSTDNITITMTGGTYGGWVGILEYSGLNTTATAVDVSSAAGGTSSSPNSGNTPVTTGANELVLSLYGEDGQGASWTTAPAGTARINHMSDTVNGDLWVSDKDSGASGTAQSASGTINNSQWGMICVVYKLAAAAAVPTAAYLTSTDQPIFIPARAVPY